MKLSTIKRSSNSEHIKNMKKGSMSDNERWVYVSVHKKIRELEAKIFLGLVMAEKGYNVVLYRYDDYKNTCDRINKIRNYPSGVVVEVAMRKEMINLFKLFKKLGHSVAVFDEEATAFPDENVFIKQRISSEVISYIDKIFTWGDYHRDLVLSKAPHRKEDVISTGHPRLDILKPEFRKLFDSDIKSIKSKFGSYILICSNIPINIYKEKLFLLGAKKKGVVNSEEEEIIWKEEIKQNRYKKKIFVRLARRLAYEFPEVNIIFRPHYPDSARNWKKDFKGVQNIHVIKEGDVTKWLAGASVVIQSQCTTGLQTFILQTPLISYKIPNLRKIFTSKTTKGTSDIIEKLGYQAYTEKDVINYIKTIFNSKEKPLDKLNNVNNLNYYYANTINDHLASDVVIKEIDKLSEEIQACKKPQYNRLPISPRSYVISMINYLWHNVMYLGRYIKYRGQNERKIKKSAIQFFAQKFSSLKNENDFFKIKQIGNEIFIIECRK